VTGQSVSGNVTFALAAKLRNDVDPDAISGYRVYLEERGLCANTVSQRMKFARSRWEHWQTWELTGPAISAWLSTYSGWTRLTYHNHLTSLFGWLEDAGEIVENPMPLIRRPPTPRPRPRPLRERELRRALEVAEHDTRAHLLLGYLAGLRAFEIAKFHGRDITPAGIRVVGKGGVVETVPTHPLLWELAQLYPRDAYWFPSPKPGRQRIGSATVTNRIRRLFSAVGIEGATHRARHTYGTMLLRQGANLRVVQELMRHGSLATTAVYLGVDDDERRTAIDGLVA
jgi:integrase/recombinase XerD